MLINSFKQYKKKNHIFLYFILCEDICINVSHIHVLISDFMNVKIFEIKKDNYIFNY